MYASQLQNGKYVTKFDQNLRYLITIKIICWHFDNPVLNEITSNHWFCELLDIPVCRYQYVTLKLEIINVGQRKGYYEERRWKLYLTSLQMAIDYFQPSFGSLTVFWPSFRLKGHSFWIKETSSFRKESRLWIQERSIASICWYVLLGFEFFPESALGDGPKSYTYFC